MQAITAWESAAKYDRFHVTFLTGSDLTPDSIVNLFFWGRLWRTTGCLLFFVATHAAYWSALNEIEHLWAVLVIFLVCIQFSVSAPGENKAPCDNRNLSSEERTAQEAVVFDNALNELHGILSTATWCGHRVQSRIMPCLPESKAVCQEPGSPASARLKPVPPRTDDYALVSDVLSKLGVTVIRNTPEYLEVIRDLRFLLEHVSKRRYGLFFIACKKLDCSCGGHTADWTKGILREVDMLGGIPTSEPSATQPGSFKTLFDCIQEATEHGPAIVEPDLHLPSLQTLPVDKRWCPYCPSFVCTSLNESEQHKSRVHGPTMTGEAAGELAPMTWSCSACDQKFTSRWEHQRHAKKEGKARHRLVGAKPRSEPSLWHTALP